MDVLRPRKQLLRSEALRDISPPPDGDGTVAGATTAQLLQVQSDGIANQKHLKKKQGNSTGSDDSGSPSVSRDSSTENYTDSTGVDLEKFIIDTLQNNKNGRMFLLKVEQELTQLVKDASRQSHKFQPMTSYNRMLVHRVAAFFGFEHNIDKNEQGTGIVVNKTKNTRIPDFKFNDYIKDNDLSPEPKKSILKRDSASLEDANNHLSPDGIERSPDRQTSDNDNRGKTFEEREERYSKVRARIFNQDSSSSSSAEASDNNIIHVILESTENSSDNNKQQKDKTSLPNGQEARANWTSDARPWNSVESDSSGRVHKSNLKQNSNHYRLGNSLDSDSAKITSQNSAAPAPASGMSLLTPDGFQSADQANNQQSKSRPTVTKASSFGGISRENSMNGNRRLMKSGSFNVTSTLASSNNCSPSITPKTVGGQQKNHVHQSAASNSMPTTFYNQQAPTASQSQHWVHVRHNNDQMNHNNNNINWPHTVFPGNCYGPFVLANTDSNISQCKDQTTFSQANQHLLLTPLHRFSQPIVNSEQHLTSNHESHHQPALIYFPYHNLHQQQQSQQIGFKHQPMQLPENSLQRVTLEAIMSQLGTISMNSPSQSTAMQHQQSFPFIRPQNTHSNMNPNVARLPVQSHPIANHVQSHHHHHQQSQQSQQQHHQQQHHHHQQQQQQQQHSHNHQQHPIRLVYPSPSNIQPNIPLLGSQIASYQGQQISLTNPNQVAFNLQQNPIGFSPAHSGVHSNSNGLNPIVPTTSIYGTQIQVPPGIPMYLFNNMQSSNLSPANPAHHLMSAQPSTVSQAQLINSTISPFVGVPVPFGRNRKGNGGKNNRGKQ